jgi:uncharacterized membrane protein YeaQ/YmgE (transglycosylase-associated protein family)
MEYVWFLLIGLAAGYIAGVVWKGSGFGLLWDLIIGVAGAYIGGFLFKLLNLQIGPGWIGELVAAVVGALLLLFVLSKIKFK